MRALNDTKDLDTIMGNNFKDRFYNVDWKNTGKKALTWGSLFFTGLYAFLNISCAKPIETKQETKEPEAVVETYEEPEIEEEPENIVEEVKDPLQEKISQYDLEGLMTEIQKNDQELYEHYTTGDIDKFLPVLADISNYISNENILERRPTTDSLKELDSIIANLKTDEEKRTYVENSFKKAEALIISAYSGIVLADVLLRMWLSDQLNIDYTVINNTNNQTKESQEYFEWWKQNSGMWEETKEYYNQIQEAIKNGSNDKIKINFKTNEIFDMINYFQNKDNLEKLITFLDFDTLGGTCQIKTMDGFYDGFNQNLLVDKMNKTPQNIEAVWIDGSCEAANIKYENLNDNNKYLAFTKSKIGGTDEIKAIVYLLLKNNFIVGLNELNDVLNGVGAIDNTDYKLFNIDQKIFDIDPYNKYDLQVYSKNFENNPSVLYYHVESIDKIK